jgi:hypothetical protein
LSACSKSENKKDDTSANCFECAFERVIVKYCKKNENTVTITATDGKVAEDTYGNGWENYVKDSKAGAVSIGGTCK